MDPATAVDGWEPRAPLVRPDRVIEPSGCKGISVSEEPANPAERDLAEVPAVEVVATVAIHLMSAAAIKCGLSEDSEPDLAEARILINALAGLVTASAGDVGSFHAAPLRDGLMTLQRAFREASAVPDAPGDGPGEKWTGPVY